MSTGISAGTTPGAAKSSFTDRLRLALTGKPDSRLAFLGNFEVEQQWARGERGLPRPAFAPSRAIVNHMDEFALLLARDGDHVVLKEAPDDRYLTYLASLGLPLPSIHPASGSDPAFTVTEDALADAKLLGILSRLAGAGVSLAPHGISDLEEQLAQRTGMTIAGATAVTCKRVNSKVYSRKLAGELCVRQARGWTCENLTELDDAIAAAHKLLEAGRPVAVKDAFGVSGKGIVVARDKHRLEQIHRMIVKNAARSGSGPLSLVVEEWLATRGDLNYQFTISRDGSVTFDFVKDAITEHGTHKGHRMPSSLRPSQVTELADCSFAIGGRMFADGYFGVVGVDALIGSDEALYPVVEINARNNMSTYQSWLQERYIGTTKVALATAYPLLLAKRVTFAALCSALGPALFLASSGEGFLPTSFATVNGAAPRNVQVPDAPFEGRAHGVIIASSWNQVTALDRAVAASLATLAG